MDEMTEFESFPKEALQFLRELRSHNSKQWFRAHSRDYELYCLSPAKEFVLALGKELKAIAPDIRAEPKVLGSIFRIARDTRYAHSDEPYKDHIDFYFWEGDRKMAVSGLFARLSSDFVGVGAGCHRFQPVELRHYREALTKPALARQISMIVRDLESKGYKISGNHYKRYPSGFTPTSGRFPLHNALYVHTNHAAGIASQKGALVKTCIRCWTDLLPLHKWLVDHVQARL